MFTQILDYFGADTPRELGRLLYKSSCGVATTFLVPREPEKTIERVYYEDAPDVLPEGTTLWISSIVEGSDVEVEGGEAKTPEEVDAVIEAVCEEVDFYWKRDNLVHACLNDEHYFMWGWGGDDGLPDGVTLTSEQEDWLNECSPNGNPQEKTFSDGSKIATLDTSCLMF